MQRYIYPPVSEWPSLLQRPKMDVSELFESVRTVLNDVKTEGDVALHRYSEKFDGFTGPGFKVTAAETESAAALLSPELKAAIKQAAANILKFHSAQQLKVEKVETQPGVICWQKSVGIEKVGLYIPGGTAPLFSTVLMLAIPASIAGCQEIVLCTPPDKTGAIHPAILFAASVAGVKTIYKLGGIQAIGAMAYGTQSIPKVYKIFGPGNRYVTAAKQLVSLADVAIDMPAGPSEVLVMADDSARPAFVAADLLSQAEHGADSQVILLTTSQSLLDETLAEVEKQVALLPREDGTRKALTESRAILLHSVDEMIRMSNAYAPEHLILSVDEPETVVDKIVNAGSVFMGHFTPESAGDYASGTNHTLPTHGHARAYSGVNLDSFIRKITFQKISESGLRELGPVIEQMAGAEKLQAHKNAVTIRLNSLK
ncbi:histidinol dehydrogenase [Geofilum sp. OHC36d9]|uniref:histidinol dehydrogenase n=1 Tax=Geofilum sp. OHC36d9 TaxID=3458413 RepID=UPI0040343D50